MPYCEWAIDRSLAASLLGWPVRADDRNIGAQTYTIDEMNALADALYLDNLTCTIRAPVYSKKTTADDGRVFYGDGLIRNVADMDKLALPDPRDDAPYAKAEEVVKGKGKRAAVFATRIGVFPAMLSMGIETFSLSLLDDPSFAEAMMDAYFDWAGAVA